MMSALDSCRWVRTQIPRFLDGELADDLAGRVSAHLDRCPGCRTELASERDLLLDTFATLVPAEPPAALLDTVMARIDESELVTTSLTEPTEAPATSPAALDSLEDRAGRPRLPSFVPGLAAAALLAFVLWAIAGDNGGGAAPIGEGNSFAMVPTETGSGAGATDERSRFEPGTPISEVDALYASAPIAGTAGSPASAITLARGDVNSDGRVDERDVDQFTRHLGHGAEIACPAAADMNDDGVVDPQDGLRLLQFSLGDSAVIEAVGKTFAYEDGGALHCSYQACP